VDDKMNWGQSPVVFSESEQKGVVTPFNQVVSRRSVLRAGAGLLVVAAGTGTFFELQRGITFADKGGGTLTPNAAIQWNNAALQAIRDINPGPTIGSRALAIMHTCMYDAWAAYDQVAVPTRPNGIPRQKAPKDVTQAVSYAAYRALMDLFPKDTSVFTSLMQSLGFDPSNTSTDVTTQAGVGNVAAKAVLAFRHGDGSNQLNGYADTSGYTSVNSPTQINDPVRWQPLLVNNKTQNFLTPHWGKVAPFALTSGSQFRPAGPVMDATSSAYKSQVDTIIQYSAALCDPTSGDTTKTIADYWANGPHSETPPGHWMLFAQFTSAQYISAKDKHALRDDVLLFFALSNAVFDAGIAAWDAKRAFDYVRPITAVHYLYNGQTITCWGGYNIKNTMQMDGSKWNPYQESIVVTPPFPEYVSGHSTFSAAGAYIMQQATFSDTFGSTFTAAPGSSLIEPGFAPTTSVTLSWPTFSAAAAQAGLSRQYGGIHFNQGDQDGRALGKQVAMQVWNKAVAYVIGKA
jgi:hypothetical protein